MSIAHPAFRTQPQYHLKPIAGRDRWAKLRRLAGRVASYGPLKNLLSVPLTTAGAACFSVAAFLGNTIAGFAVTGICLIVLEAVIADEE